VIARALARFVVFAVLAIVAWILGRALRAPSSRPVADARTRRAPAAAAEPLVRDRMCNTYLPRSSAVVDRAGGLEHFFCSEGCRRQFHERRATVP
jgi:hypothetical protein